MFESNASWSLPAHLYMVSGWSAALHPGRTCRRAARPRSSCPTLPGDLGPAPHTPPDYAWTDLTYLLHKHHVSWAYYLKKGPEPDCETGQMFCLFRNQDPRTPGIWNPLPAFDTVRQDGQLGNIKDTSALFTTLRQDKLPAVSWVIPSGVVVRAPDLEHRRRAGLRDPHNQRDHALAGVVLDRDSAHLGRLGRLL